MASSPKEKKGPLVKLQVVDTRRRLTDPTVASQEELTTLIEEAAEAPRLGASRESLRAFLDIARSLQGPRRALSGAEPPPNTLDSVLARDALSLSGVRAVLGGADARPCLRARAADRVRAVDSGGKDAALAAEETACITGFAVDSHRAGAFVFEPGPFLGADAYIAGAGSVPALAAAVGPHPPEAPETREQSGLLEKQGRLLEKQGLAFVPIGEPAGAAPRALLRQARAAARHYLGSAAAAMALARVAAAARGDPHAEPALRAVFTAPAEPAGPAGEPAGQAGPAGEPAESLQWRNESLRFLAEHLAATEPIAADSADTWRYDTSILHDLYRTGAFEMYLHALAGGREAPELREFFNARGAHRAREAARREAEAREAEAQSLARLYTTIIEDKLGSARSHAVLSALRVHGARARGAPGGSLALPSQALRADDPEAVLAQLSAPERAVVAAEHSNRLRALEASSANRCPHLEPARRLRSAPTAAAALRAFEELAGFFAPGAAPFGAAAPGAAPFGAAAPGAAPFGAAAPGAAAAWIMCRSCGFRLICPHVCVRIRLEARRASYAEMRDSLMRYAVQVALAVAAGDTPAAEYFCRTCGERLAEAEVEEEAAPSRYGELGADLRTRLWGYAAAAARNVRFPTPTDERRFATAVTESVFPLFIEFSEGGEARRRRAAAAKAEAEEDPRALLDAALFVYAYILRQVRDKNAVVAGSRPGAKEGAVAGRILEIIYAEHRGLISQISDITPEHISARFVEVYRRVRAGSAEAPERPEEEFLYTVAVVDPTFRYAATVAQVTGAAPLHTAGPAAARRVFELVFGLPLPDLLAQARAASRDPELALLYLRRPGTAVPTGLTEKDPRVNLYSRLYPAPAAPPAAAAAFAAAAAVPTRLGFWLGGARPARPARPAGATLWERKTSGASLAEKGCFYESYRLFVAYTLTGSPGPGLEAARRGEATMRAERAVAALRPYHDYAFAAPAPSPDALITEIYDEEGRRHDWSNATFIYEGLEAEGRAGVKKAIEAGQRWPGKPLIDLRCRVCGTLASRTHELDAEKAWAALRAGSELEAFYVFYESRCPEKGLHERSVGAADSGACAKCGLRPGELGKEYHKKYAAAFASDRAALRTAVVPPAAAPAASPAAAPATEAAAPPWKSDYSLVLRAAEISGMPPEAISAIGATEGRDYELALKRAAIEKEPAWLARAYAADAEVRLFLADYNALRLRATTQPASAAEALEKAGPAEAPLPPLPAGRHREGFAALRQNPERAHAFAVQSLCSYVAEAAASGPLGAAFAALELRAILRSQRLLAQPGKFNWAIFVADEGEESEQVGDVGEDVLADVLLADREEAPDDPFSGAHIDYDTSEDNPNNE